MPKRFTCDHCGKTYSQKPRLKNHIKRDYEKVPVERFPCTECGKSFSTRTNLNRHVSIVHSSERFSCNGCNKRFACKRACDMHMRVCEKNKGTPIKCSNCSKTFSRQDNLRRHQTTCCDQNNNTVEKEQIVCEICRKKYKTMASLKFHIKTVHSSNRVYVCDICGDQFTRLFSLRRHNERMHKH